MKALVRFAPPIIAGALLIIPIAFTNAASITLGSVSPGTSVAPKTSITFSITPSGLSSPWYTITDSFASSTLASSNIGGGNFFWVPVLKDVGTHVITIKGTDASGETASVTQTITVLPPPSITINSISPGTTIAPGGKLAFTARAEGFSSPKLIISDAFNGSSIGAANIDASGNFSWTPDLSQNGDHVITIYASDSTGQSASVQQSIRVGAGPTLTVYNVKPSANVELGQTLTFDVTANNFSPTGFSVGDSFPSSTVSPASISTLGSFSWFPNGSDVGVHTLTVVGTVGAYGDSAKATQVVTVRRPGDPIPTALSAATTTPAASSGGTTGSGSSLQAQLEALKKLFEEKIKMLRGGEAQGSAEVSGETKFTFTRFLSRGSSGEEVLQLQKKLTVLGFMKVTPNGYFGPATEKAVKAFQTEKGIKAAGYVGPATRAALNE